MMIRTKIVATVGPASGSKEMIRKLVQAGCDLFRINFSHGTIEQREEFLRNIRGVETELGEPLAVIGDLCGPKVRVGQIAGGAVLLGDGQKIVIQREPAEGHADRISITLAELVDHAEPGQDILMDDGKIRLEVVETRRPREIVCRVVQGGVLAGGKGVNLPHTKMDISALTEKDLRDAAWIAARSEFDYVAQSFVRRARDVETLRKLLRDAACEAHIIAKIEKPQAVEHIDEIVQAADAIMVARGDLGVEMDAPAVPVTQKRIARLCQASGKPCIIATQMLESMKDSPEPTRAEVSDVANAVLDHADAVMLSAETSVGKFPVQAVRMMNRIAAETQAYHDETYQATRVVCAPARTAAALAAAVREIVGREEVAAVAVFTNTGRTALMFAKHRFPCPILALTPDRSALRRMCLYYGVQSVFVPLAEHTREILSQASKFALETGTARVGQKIVVVSGRPIGKTGATNTLVLHTLGSPDGGD